MPTTPATRWRNASSNASRLPRIPPSPRGARRLVAGGNALWQTLEIIGLDDADDPHDGETLRTTHVYGLGIDDEVGFAVEDVASPEDFFSHRDDQNTLLSVTDALGEDLTDADRGRLIADGTEYSWMRDRRGGAGGQSGEFIFFEVYGAKLYIYSKLYPTGLKFFGLW